MTNHATLLRQIRAEARPYIEQWLEIGEVFAGFRKLAADNDLDWGVIKALIKAEVQDEQDEQGGSKRVAKIIDKADCASAYADMLGLGGGEEKINFSSEPDIGIPISLPPHDEDGVIIEPDGLSGPSSEEGADAIALDAPSSPSVSTRRECGVGSNAVPEDRGARHHVGSTDGGSHAHEVATAADSKSSDNRQVLDEPSGAGPGSAVESGAQVSSSVAAIPFSATDAPVEQSPSHDNAPGAPHSGEWPELPARFDRREKAA